MSVACGWRETINARKIRFKRYGVLRILSALVTARRVERLIWMLFLFEINKLKWTRQTYTPRSIKSRNFIAICHALYLKSNTNNESIIRIKEILDSWLTECSDNYNKTERIATKNNFRKAVYMYYVLNITNCYND